MRAKKEIIKLDAVIMNVIKLSVFVSALDNGHRIVAVEHSRKDPVQCHRAHALGVGDHVVVELFPGDLATGRIVRSYGDGETAE